jgi:hypothetical protein
VLHRKSSDQVKMVVGIDSTDSETATLSDFSVVTKIDLKERRLNETPHVRPYLTAG